MKKNSMFSRGIDIQVLRVFFLILAIEAIVSFLVLLSLPKSIDNAWLFGYSLNRIVLIFVMLLISMILGGFVLGLQKHSALQEKTLFIINFLLRSERKFELVLIT
ncbi:MAG TPA: hypothetical protein PLL95_05200, partial [Anaerolineales bacterium]|nr:hypothetical protein [Anaerolineales bacterium]